MADVLELKLEFTEENNGEGVAYDETAEPDDIATSPNSGQSLRKAMCDTELTLIAPYAGV
jgi:hypothetical protein